jgi:hypothetical protein
LRHRHKPQCQENFQGDRCWKSAGHASSVAINPDVNHAGQFVGWTGEGDSKKVVARAFERKSPRRSELRQIDRVLNNFAVNPVIPVIPHGENVAINYFLKQRREQLESIIKFLRREPVKA